ncbi:MAG: hypothetical protein R2862_06385 [Thermoanaerobaculia bacterium]
MTVLGLPERRGFGGTERRDLWWGYPAIVATILLAHRLCHLGRCSRTPTTTSATTSLRSTPRDLGTSHSLLAQADVVAGVVAKFSPAPLILPFPAGFRLTCHYYRGAYYKAIWQDPPACTVGEPRKKYRGENSFPLIAQNIHRYFYFGLIFCLPRPRRPHWASGSTTERAANSSASASAPSSCS